jgi:glycosyltransferase involved in cell wall biosynthesis
MHIVHLLASPFVGGPEHQVLGLARHLPPPYRTTILSFAERGLARPLLDAARGAGFDAVELRHNAPSIRSCIREIADELRQCRADVLCTNGYKPDVIGWWAARRVDIPVIAISHGWTAATPKVRLNELIDRVVLRWMDAVVCVSAAQAARVRRALVPARKVVTIANAVSAEAFAPADPAYRTVLVKLFAKPPRAIVGAAGRFSPEKNFALFVDAAATVAAQRPDTGFVLFGDGPLRGVLEQQITRLGMSERFVLAGFRTDLGKLLPHLDLAVLSSITEGLPVILLEALAAGVPMVATAVGGVPEALEDGRSGYLVPPGDRAALARRILDALADDSVRRAMGRYAQQHVREHFSFEEQARRYRELFARVLGKRQA